MFKGIIATLPSYIDDDAVTRDGADRRGDAMQRERGSRLAALATPSLVPNAPPAQPFFLLPTCLPTCPPSRFPAPPCASALAPSRAITAPQAQRQRRIHS